MEKVGNRIESQLTASIRVVLTATDEFNRNPNFKCYLCFLIPRWTAESQLISVWNERHSFEGMMKLEARKHAHTRMHRRAICEVGQGVLWTSGCDAGGNIN